MPIIERDVILQGIDENGNQTMDMPITRLGNVEDTADVKSAPEKTDYIPVIDMADKGQMKKVPVAALQAAVGKEYLPQSRSVTLTASGWTGSGPYTQTVAVEGVRADETAQLVQPVPAARSMGAWEAAGVKCTEQGAGALTFKAEEKPAEDMQIFVILQEVAG